MLSARIALKSPYMQRPASKEPLCIAMVDGESFHGGMCDRFKGIISLYAYCKYNNLPFRIRYTFPFKLEDYLVPAQYDWTLKDGEYTDNPLYHRVLYMRGEHYATRLLHYFPTRQVHFYTNRDLLSHINGAYCDAGIKGYDWGELYRELFKPGAALKQRIDEILAEIGGDYDAAVFRFQNLLGDFKEYHFKALTEKSEVEDLLAKCLDYVKQLRASSPCKRLLVTSDSITFLRRVAQIDGVYVIPGTLSHMDCSKHGNAPANAADGYLKSFLDFYMISMAQKIYRVGTPLMYQSEFPVYAAKINDRPFESVTI
ncbi:MAG: hypothetical protein ACI4UN_02750 [Muribaculaceae bacterium]